jgi:EmrB/QacA subfamily drug resistance transporter
MPSQRRLTPGGAAAETTEKSEAVPGRRRITVGVLLALTVVAVEVTVVTTAMPTVVGELRGLELYPWVFSAYLLASTVTVPIFGKLSDLYGRRPVFLGGMAVFLLGSTLCGFATSMPMLVACRAFQGLGAGALQPLVWTILADIYPLKERSKVQGAVGMVWAVASLAGPGLGALLTLTLSWRWVFFINIPFALLAAWFIWRFLREQVDRQAVRIDYAGAGAISLGLLVLLVTVLEGGRALAWGSPPMLMLLGLSAALLAGFVWIERRAPEPLMPLTIFRIPIVSISVVANLLQGAHIFSLSAYVPLYVQGVRGESAFGSGLVLMPLLVSWSVSALAGPRLILRFGFRTAALVSTGLLLIGSLPLLALGPTTPALLLTASMTLLGCGFGPSGTVFIVAAQGAVSWELRGVVTSTSQLFRNLGGTVGVALLGALLNSRLQVALPGDSTDRGALLNPELRQALSPEVIAGLQGALADALGPVFVTLVVLALLNVALVLRYATNAPIQPAPAPGAARTEANTTAQVT